MTNFVSLRIQTLKIPETFIEIQKWEQYAINANLNCNVYAKLFFLRNLKHVWSDLKKNVVVFFRFVCHDSWLFTVTLIVLMVLLFHLFSSKTRSNKIILWVVVWKGSGGVFPNICFKFSFFYSLYLSKRYKTNDTWLW